MPQDLLQRPNGNPTIVRATNDQHFASTFVVNDVHPSDTAREGNVGELSMPFFRRAAGKLQQRGPGEVAIAWYM